MESLLPAAMNDNYARRSSSPSTNHDNDDTNDNNIRWSTYLALLPRGVQSIVSDIIQDKLGGKKKKKKNNDGSDDDDDDDGGSYEYRIELLSPQGMVEDDDDTSIIEQATKQTLIAQEKKLIKLKKRNTNDSNNNNNKKRKSASAGSDHVIDTRPYCAKPVGSAFVTCYNNNNDNDINVGDDFKQEQQDQEQDQQQQESKLHIFVGYDEKNNPIWSCPGNLSGCVWYKLTTTAPASIVGNLRCFGPLLALVTTTSTSSTSKSTSTTSTTSSGDLRVLPWHTLTESCDDLKEWISQHNQPTYEIAFDQALQLWHDHTKTSCWRDVFYNNDDDDEDEHQQDINGDYYQKLQDRFHTDTLSFRLSSIRDSSYINKKQKHNQKYIYGRQELLDHGLDFGMIPTKYSESWTVNLKHFDIEIVLLIYDSMVAIGLSLRPYNILGAKTFSSGVIPPDISKPYLGSDALAGLVRLRPSTAHILLKFANIQPGDIVLDPCAGIGTIPLEAEMMISANNNNNNTTIGLGGDLVLNHPKIANAACSLLSAATSSSSSKTNAKSVSSLVAWDAAHLPIRTASIDVVVSDLPFGKKCLSASALSSLLPLVVSELARVLIPSQSSTISTPSSRMVLLCGSYESLLQAVHGTSQYWRLPCKAIIPTNIGGICAWIVQIERNDIPYKEGIDNRLERVKKLTSKHHRAASHGEQQVSSKVKKSRIQSKCQL